MTDWTAYQVSFQMLAPMHIGYRKIGNLQQTRYYVPARTLWGALTAQMTREFTSAKKKDYEDIGKAIDENLRFSYFYPSEESNKLNLFPWGNTKSEFEWTFISSQMSTSIKGETKSSEDGLLHETEFILPISRNGKQVYLNGYVFEKNDNSDQIISKWKEQLSNIQLGGERGYGWGRVKVDEKTILECSEVFNFETQLNQTEDPIIKLNKDCIIMSHVRFNSEDFEGKAEMFASRKTTDGSKHGNAFEEMIYCWQPGTKISKDMGFKFVSQKLWEKP
ncbi:RAMP superfamily CRISPR-associated protein [Methanolapillus ohkumae]|uniref:CRISPR type III-associated protein domain-containing protein n=1 Tax=Methanolapillus ohkumae TaxID=3028298 RepID=A0AA96V5M6_9EURY|nr:hypothetical protein MsAm2_00800 [Methanosarcinaceae archaeon Am2]